jgi:quinate/shikimate dehydrogenase
MKIDAKTGLYCLIGSPVSHSGSPAMYNYCFDRMGINAAYLAFDVKKEDTAAAIAALRLLHVRGFNITMPCKTETAKCCDELSPAAELIGAVNTVVNEDGRLIGHNTDGYGWVRSCRESGIEVTGSRITILGAGGAATAIAVTAALEGAAEISIAARENGHSYANAQETVKKISDRTNCRAELIPMEDEEQLALSIRRSGILVNATNVGMKPNDGVSLIKDTSLLRRDLVVSDIIYNPEKTKLLQDAEEAGCRCLYGRDMLLWQGAEAFRLYTGLEMPVEEVKKQQEG